jgi:hypothetical protein
MKVRVGFVTNSSSSSYIVTGLNKLKALSLKELRSKAKDWFGEGETCDEIVKCFVAMVPKPVAVEIKVNLG